MRPSEMWGGIECTVVRIDDTWRDQVRETGHHDHPDDLVRIAGLGIRTLRYPVLWERCHPRQRGACGWALHGGNGQTAYVDTEAARVNLPIQVSDWVMALRDTWQRYDLPIAITEAHLGCNDPREQVHWLIEAWRAALAMRAEKADIRAVTAWALLGLVDWDTMLCERNECFEPGALSARDGVPQSTLLSEAIASLAQGDQFTHPSLLGLGWWQRGDRVHIRRA